MGSQASPMQKAMLNRQQVRQRPILAPPPLQTVNQSPHTGGHRNFGGSPTVQPTPPSQHSSPSTSKSPAFAIQGGIASPNSDFQAQTQNQQARGMPGARHVYAPHQQSHMRSMSGPGTSQPQPGSRAASHASSGSYYHPQFQKHYDQLGKFTRKSPSFPARGALFVLGLFREYRTGVRCTSWHARRSGRRRTRHRQLHSKLPPSDHDCWPKRLTSLASNDHCLWKRHWWGWRTCHRSLRSYAGRRSLRVDGLDAFPQSLQLSATAAAKIASNDTQWRVVWWQSVCLLSEGAGSPNRDSYFDLIGPGCTDHICEMKIILSISSSVEIVIWIYIQTQSEYKWSALRFIADSHTHTEGGWSLGRRASI
jgi:hypothetical protein